MNRTAKNGFVAGLVLLLIGSGPRDAAAQDPSEFLKRLDANNNGMIDPAELEGRFGGFIQRMAENNPRLDLSRPVPISRMAEEFTRMREERMQSGGGGPPFGGPGGGPPGGGFQGRGGPPGGSPPGRGGPPGRGDDQSGRGGRGDDQNNPYRPPSTPTKVAPLVPAFGEELEAFVRPPGFGAEGELFTIQVNDADRQEAARAFGYYDANKDGKVDREEMNRSRYGADLLMYDRNRDGVITLDEMEYRYARRPVENTRNAGGGGGSPPGGNTADRGGRGNRDSGREGGDRGSSESDENPSPYSKLSSYRILPLIERLPQGLPDWFARNDADGDGQIAMAEFSSTWTEAVLEDFAQFDLNSDGLVTPEECLKAVAAGAVRGTAIAAAAGTGSPAEPAPGSQEAASSAPATTSQPASSGDTAADSGGGPPIDPRYLDYYKKLVAKYDASGDGVLTANEWVNMSKNPAAADANGDGRITVEEYARWSMQR